jgi:hypothetical protein
MAQAIADPESLKRFASQLQNYVQAIQSGQTVLQAQLHALGDTWRDQEHEKFLEAFQELKIMVQRFTAAANEHIPFLLRKAKRVEEYLQQR